VDIKLAKKLNKIKKINACKSKWCRKKKKRGWKAGTKISKFIFASRKFKVLTTKKQNTWFQWM
jgi:hypothetical protein